ncbi:LacI family transcriptional regulator [Mycolicibacterium smegmatis]|nr:LacI family transcriptional regulator [Mycolicibacterium smegmatis]
MSEATRARVLAAADELNYVPNARARALRHSRSGTIGLIVPDVNNAVFADMFSGVQMAASGHSTDVLLGQIDAPPRGTQQLSRLVSEGRVDGVLLQRREDFDDDMLAAVLEGVPAVTINSRVPGRVGSVILDDQKGGGIATEHLITLGHSRIAFISGTAIHDTAQRRKEGYLETLASAGLRSEAAWVVDAGWEADAGSAALNTLYRGANLGKPDGPTAVVVASVNAAVGALSTALRLGLRVPEDLSIVGINTTWVSDTVYPALTTVRLPLQRLGEVAADVLMEHLGGRALTDTVVTQPTPELLVRETTAPPTRD